MTHQLSKPRLRNRRSYCRRRIKDRYPVDGRSLTIKLPYTKLSEVPVPDRYYVRQLIKLGYQVQLSLF